MCDHVVGYTTDFILQSEAADTARNAASHWNDHNKIMNTLTKENEKALKEDYTGKDFLDRRRNYLTMFHHCPYCGEKINWREIKNAI